MSFHGCANQRKIARQARIVCLSSRCSRRIRCHKETPEVRLSVPAATSTRKSAVEARRRMSLEFTLMAELFSCRVSIRPTGHSDWRATRTMGCWHWLKGAMKCNLRPWSAPLWSFRVVPQCVKLRGFCHPVTQCRKRSNLWRTQRISSTDTR